MQNTNADFVNLRLQNIATLRNNLDAEEYTLRHMGIGGLIPVSGVGGTRSGAGGQVPTIVAGAPVTRRRTRATRSRAKNFQGAAGQATR